MRSIMNTGDRYSSHSGVTSLLFLDDTFVCIEQYAILNMCVLLCFIDPRVRKIRNECDGNFRFFGRVGAATILVSGFDCVPL